MCACTARVTVFSLFVCLSVTTLCSTPLAYKLKVWCQQVGNGVFLSLIWRIFVKRFTIRVMELFAYHDRPWCSLIIMAWHRVSNITLYFPTLKLFHDNIHVFHVWYRLTLLGMALVWYFALLGLCYTVIWWLDLSITGWNPFSSVTGFICHQLSMLIWVSIILLFFAFLCIQACLSLAIIIGILINVSSVNIVACFANSSLGITDWFLQVL